MHSSHSAAASRHRFFLSSITFVHIQTVTMARPWRDRKQKKKKQQASAAEKEPQAGGPPRPPSPVQSSSSQPTGSGRGQRSIADFNICIMCILRGKPVQRVGFSTRGMKHCGDCGASMGTVVTSSIQFRNGLPAGYNPSSSKRPRDDAGDEEDEEPSNKKSKPTLADTKSNPEPAAPKSVQKGQRKSQKHLPEQERRWCFLCKTTNHVPGSCKAAGQGPDKSWKQVCLDLGWKSVTGFWDADMVERMRSVEPVNMKHLMNHIWILETDISKYIDFVYDRDKVLQHVFDQDAMMDRIGGYAIAYGTVPFYESIYSRANRCSQSFVQKLETTIHVWYNKTLGGHFPTLPNESTKDRNFRASKTLAMSTSDTFRLDIDAANQLIQDCEQRAREYNDAMDNLEQEYRGIIDADPELDADAMTRAEWRLVQLPTRGMRLALTSDQTVSWLPVFSTPEIYSEEEYLIENALLLTDEDYEQIVASMEPPQSPDAAQPTADQLLDAIKEEGSQEDIEALYNQDVPVKIEEDEDLLLKLKFEDADQSQHLERTGTLPGTPSEPQEAIS